MTQKIVENLYARFGTDSGILLGIASKEVVTLIVKLAVSECIDETKEALGDYEGDDIRVNDELMEFIEALKS